GEEWRLTAWVRGLDVGAGIGEPSKHTDMTVLDRDMDRGQPVAGRAAHVCTRCEQPVDQIAGVDADGPVQRRGTARVPPVDVEALLQQILHGFSIASPGRLR